MLALTHFYGFLPKHWFWEMCQHCLTISNLALHCSVFTCELLHGLQSDTDGLVCEQWGGGQRAWHALHYANVLHALGHGEWGHGVVSFKGTVAVYAATCRTGGNINQYETYFSALTGTFTFYNTVGTNPESVSAKKTNRLLGIMYEDDVLLWRKVG